MSFGTKTARLHIGGMTCVNCQNKIERNLRNIAGVRSATVNYSAGTASITYDADVVTLKDIIAVIQKLDYTILAGGERPKSGVLRVAGLLLVIASLYLILERVGVLNLLAPSQLAQADMGYGMLFVIGLVTSVHCVAMCGGINLSQCISQGDSRKGGGRFSALRPTFLYNTGRVISYTAVGFIVGALGSVITFSPTLQGALKLLAGVLMVIMGLNMLGVFPWLRRLTPRMPRFFARKIDVEKGRSNSPLIVGLLNGLMPCGPLQAMQIYALSTGNPFSGALSMFLFSLGTVPLMFGLGALSSLLSKKFTRNVMTVGAVLVVVLGLSMFTQGWSLSGLMLPELIPQTEADAQSAPEATAEAQAEDGVQVVNSTLQPGRYPDITVRVGTPVKWTIDAPQGSINGCNNRMIIGEYGIEHSLTAGENVIEFTPTKVGKVPYSCWMGMIRATITVVDAGAAPADNSQSADTAQSPDTTPEAASPKPAGYRIPTDEVAVATLKTDENGDVQTVDVTLTDRGFSPAIVVVQRDRDVEWNIVNQAPDADAGTGLLVPAYTTQLALDKGDNPLTFTPDESFDFSTGDNTFYGYVKVVDDLNHIDIQSIKEEAAAHETLIYPADYFASTSACPCCGANAG